MSKYILFVSYQPLNKCWGVQYRKGNINHNEVNESLLIAFAEMAKFIETEKSRLSPDCTCNDGMPKAQKGYFICPAHGEQNQDEKSEVGKLSDVLKLHYEANDKQNFLIWLEGYISKLCDAEYAKGFDSGEAVNNKVY